MRPLPSLLDRAGLKTPASTALSKQLDPIERHRDRSCALPFRRHTNKNSTSVWTVFPPQQYPDTRIVTIFKARHLVINEVKAHVNLSQTLLQKVSYYYNLRNKLIHERATVGITDEQVTDYRRTVELVLKKLFKLQFPKAD
jgi:hypothetical protein